ncbi:MAG: 6-phosphofructokinase [Thermoanaerobaculia bacterium]|nr:MAG: 6-phosphofructokinase [Thermoanaerobaculia bacterium]
MTTTRIGVLTGGGDAPGLNAVLRAVVRTVERLPGFEAVGVLDGFEGLLEQRYLPLTVAHVRDLLRKGGTILGTTNRTNPFSCRGPDGSVANRSGEVLANARRARLDALIVIGGDGTLRIARELGELGLPVIGVPKTIDNDLAATDYTFGFWTAIETATDALDRLRDTAESHHRVMILEVMGRDAGWIALHAGIAGGADVILIPEIPYRVESVERHIEARASGGQAFSLVVVAEGAAPVGGAAAFRVADAGDGHPRLGGAGERLAGELAPRIEHEIRVTVLGHLQRGGSPVPFDRILATRLGEHAARLAAAGRSGVMVRLLDGRIGDVGLAEAVSRAKRVDPEGALVATARSIGVGFGDDG